MKRTIHFITTLLLLALLAACVPVETADPASDGVMADATSAPEEEASASDCKEGFRTTNHDYGTTCVPVDPQRIAVTDIDIAAFMRLLDIQSVALDMTQWNELVNASPEWGDEGEAFVADAVDLGQWPYNMEAMAAANPDLILAAGVEDYELLSEIAPTVAFNIYDNNENRWSTFAEYFGSVLNAQEETQALIDATNERIAALGDYADEVGDPSVSVFSSWDGTVNYGAPYFAYNQIMAQADIERPDNQALTQADYESQFEEYWANVSLERLDTIDADRLLLLSFDWREGDEVEAFVGEPIWAALEAVQNEQFFAVPGQQWFAFDPYSINKTIDDLIPILGGADPTEVSPNPFLSE